ncbi:hypothetical protein GCM10010255_27870 [Streptomyces coeruleofuscus]|uniref:Uncharacterized protein n=1 Tax=Streptomyces coeruleofuscus TaxID=66879 RepID=A0ABN3I6K2_9ACTN
MRRLGPGTERPGLVRQFDAPPAQGIQPNRFHAHTTRSQLIRIAPQAPQQPCEEASKGAEVDIPPESPAGLMRHLVRKYHDKQGWGDEHSPLSADVLVITPTVMSTTRNPGVPTANSQDSHPAFYE